jgi:predicted PurR-regulated permease PerM
MTPVAEIDPAGGAGLECTAPPLTSTVEASALTIPEAHAPVRTANLPMVVVATLATVFGLSWAQAFLVPVLLGIVIAYTLNPLVSWLEVIRIPRVIGAIVVMASVLGAGALGTYALHGQMQAVIEQLPDAAAKLTSNFARLRIGESGDLQKIQSAASAVEKATTQAAGGAAAPHRPATHVIVDAPEFKLSSLLWKSSMGVIGVVVQVLTVLFLIFFMLLGGDTFRRKLVRLTGPSLSKRKIAVHILDDINGSIQKYMLMLVSINVIVALLSWAVFRWIGLENAGAWGVLAGVLHVVPYLGPGITAAATGMAAFLQFDSLPLALLAAGGSLTIATIVGTFVTTWLTGRIAKMNAAAVFISLLFWGWLWGVWGMLLSVPIIVIVKVVSQHLRGLQPVAELLGDESQ